MATEQFQLLSRDLWLILDIEEVEVRRISSSASLSLCLPLSSCCFLPWPVLHPPLCLLFPTFCLFLVQMLRVQSCFFLLVRQQQGTTQRPTDPSVWGLHPECWCSQRPLDAGLQGSWGRQYFYSIQKHFHYLEHGIFSLDSVFLFIICLWQQPCHVV